MPTTPDPRHSQTRRQFLVNSGLVAGASLATALDISRSAYAAAVTLSKSG